MNFAKIQMFSPLQRVQQSKNVATWGILQEREGVETQNTAFAV